MTYVVFTLSPIKTYIISLIYSSCRQMLYVVLTLKLAKEDVRFNCVQSVLPIITLLKRRGKSISNNRRYCSYLVFGTFSLRGHYVSSRGLCLRFLIENLEKRRRFSYILYYVLLTWKLRNHNEDVSSDLLQKTWKTGEVSYILYYVLFTWLLRNLYGIFTRTCSDLINGRRGK